MNKEQIDACIEVPFSFDDILDDAFDRLEKKQADIFLRRISGLEKTLSELEESLVAMHKARGGEKTL
jgi:predicted ribosome quality control (RQC) complex YloA/Tae2 family protein